MYKIIHIGPHGKGGMASVIDNIMASNLKEKFNLKFICTQGDKFNPIMSLRAYRKMISCIKKDKIDAVHIHMASNGSFYRKSIFVKKCYKMNMKTIVHVHGAYFKEFFGALSDRKKKYVKKIFGMCDAVIGLTDDWKEFLDDLTSNVNKVYIVNNFVSVPEISAHYNDVPSVVFLGRIGDRKGTFDLLKAFKLLNKKNLKYNGIIAGDGEIDKCNNVIAQYGLNNVKCLGWIDYETRNDILVNSDILILPSYFESFGMVLVEAMSYKLPVIAGNAGSMPNVINDSIDGYLIEPGNVEDIADKLELLIKNKDLRAKLGENGYNHVKLSFSTDSFVKKMSDIYNKIIKE